MRPTPRRGCHVSPNETKNPQFGKPFSLLTNSSYCSDDRERGVPTVLLGDRPSPSGGVKEDSSSSSNDPAPPTPPPGHPHHPELQTRYAPPTIHPILEHQTIYIHTYPSYIIIRISTCIVCRIRRYRSSDPSDGKD